MKISVWVIIILLIIYGKVILNLIFVCWVFCYFVVRREEYRVFVYDVD